MTGIKDKKSTRRAFFVSGGAVLGAGVAGTVGAAALRPSESATQARGGSAEDREAIRQLHLAHVARLESEGACGDGLAAKLFGEQGNVHLGAYRQSTSQQKDDVRFSEDGLRASATFHCEVELCTPLQDDCTAAQMARLQGLTATRRWESGRFEARFVKTGGRWTMQSLSYRAS
jgi:hypothetical protein